jgi:hypothetical protein
MLYLTLKRHFLTLPVGFDDDSLWFAKKLSLLRSMLIGEPLIPEGVRRLKRVGRTAE